MDIETRISNIVSACYPSVENFSIDKYPNNSYCKVLIEKCKTASNENLIWLSFLNTLKHEDFRQVIDETLLMAGEPCFKCSITTLKDQDESITTTYYVQISVIFNCYFLYSTKSRKNPNPPPLIEHFGYDFDLYDTNESNYLFVVEKVKEYFPGYLELSGDLVKKIIDNIRVPSKFGLGPPTIFECLFGVRMF